MAVLSPRVNDSDCISHGIQAVKIKFKTTNQIKRLFIHYLKGNITEGEKGADEINKNGQCRFNILTGLDSCNLFDVKRESIF